MHSIGTEERTNAETNNVDKMTVKQLFSDHSESQTFRAECSGLRTVALQLPQALALAATLRIAITMDYSGPVKKRVAGADRACRVLVPVDDGSASLRCERQSTRVSPRGTSRQTDAKGDYSLSEDDKDEHEEFLEFLGGGLAKFYDFRTGCVKFFKKRIAASGIANDNILKKPDAAWAKVKDMEDAKECECEEKRAAFHSARAAVKLLLSKICPYEDWLEATVAVFHRSSHDFALTDGTFPAPHIFGIERDAVGNKVLVVF